MSARGKLLWLIRLLSTLEVALQAVQSDREQSLFEGNITDIDPDWRLIQQRLMPEILLIMGTIRRTKRTFQYPVAVVVPEFGEWWRVTSDEHLDVLKSELDKSVEEDEHFIALESKVRSLSNANDRQKGLRLLGQLSKLTTPD